MTTRFDVVCFGEILWDFFEAEARGDQPMARTFRCELGGSPANVAAGLARLGARTAVAGAVGRDRLGRALRRLLDAEGVSTDFVINLPNRTGMTFVVPGPNGEPEFIPYRHAGADLAMTAAHVTPAMGQATWGVVGSSSLLTPALAQATARFVEMVRAGDGLLFVDLNVRAHLWLNQDQMRTTIADLLTHADVVKASEADLLALAGTQIEHWLDRHRQKATWILTHGARGADAFGECGRIAVPAQHADLVDATGAGDAFVAGVLAVLIAAGARPATDRWADPRLWTRALEAGHLMGARAVGCVGAITGLTNLDRVRALISAPGPS
ncbi:MAG TPA: carbohydrate kinase [Vicinamibacterales bacterium]|nr:carbohydrate kinase [Vicinamibacterales bacterium]